jgi:hypothetical protein
VNNALLPLGAVLASTITGGGLWFVVRLIVRYQRDFTNRYALKIREQDKHIEILHEERRELTRRLIACQLERGALRATIRQAGLTWDPRDFGAIDEH